MDKTEPVKDRPEGKDLVPTCRSCNKVALHCGCADNKLEKKKELWQ